MSSVDNNINSWEAVSLSPSPYFYEVKSRDKEALINLFIDHAPEVNKSISLLGKLCIVLAGTPTELIKRAAQAFNERLIVYKEGILIRSNEEELDSAQLDGNSPLTFACRHLELAVVEKLLKKEEINKPNDSKTTLLMLASRYGRVDVVELLLKNGADPNAQDQGQDTALYDAVLNGNLEIVKLLLPLTNTALQAADRSTLLMEAARNNDTSIAQYLLDHQDLLGKKADPNTQDIAGCTALDYACYKGSLECVKLLLLKTSSTLKSKKGMTPLMWASQKNHPSVVQYLLSLEDLLSEETGPNAQEQEGQTALNLACVEGYLEVVKLLLPKTNSALTKKTGCTLLMSASTRNHIDVVQHLLDHKDLMGRKADPNAQDLEGYTALWHACLKGHLKIVEKLFPITSPAIKAKHGSTPLIVASIQNHHEIVQYLLDNNANANEQSIEGITALFSACQMGHIEVVKKLLPKTDSALPTKLGSTPLMAASINNHLSIMEYLLDHADLLGKKANPNTRDNEGCTALFSACLMGHIEVAKKLLQETDATLKTKDGLTPLMSAIKYKHSHIIKFLLENEVRLDDRNHKGATALHYACEWGDVKIVEWLLGHKADPDAQDCYGCTPLHFACEYGHLECVKLLFSKTAPALKTKSGLTPLMTAIKYKHSHIVKFLLENEVRIDDRNHKGATALHYACEWGDVKIIEWLLGHKANPDAQDCNGYTPLHLACVYGHLECVKLLFSKTAPTLKIKGGLTPLMTASRNNKLNIIQYLLEKGTEAHFEGLTLLDLACLAKDFDRAESLIRGSGHFSGKINRNHLTELFELLKGKIPSYPTAIDKLKVVNKFSKLNVSSELLTEKIVEEYYTKQEVQKDFELHRSRLDSAKRAEEIEQAIAGSQLFIDQLSFVFDFFTRFYGSTPKPILDMRKQVVSALEGAKRRLHALSIKKEELQEEFREKDIFQILFEWGVHPKENKSVNYRTELGQLQIEGMIDETYIAYLGVNRKQIKTKGLHCGKDLIEQMQVDNELEILILSKASQEELMKALGKKMKREQLGGKTYFKEIIEKLIKNEMNDSLLVDLIKQERDFNIAILKQEFGKK